MDRRLIASGREGFHTACKIKIKQPIYIGRR